MGGLAKGLSIKLLQLDAENVWENVCWGLRANPNSTNPNTS